MTTTNRKSLGPAVSDIAGYQPFENDLLVQSELLIEKQREHIKDLKERLLEADRLRQGETGKRANEVRILKEANAKLRLEIDLLRGELAVKADAAAVGHEGSGPWKREVEILEKKLEEANKKLRDLSADSDLVDRLSRENKDLQQKMNDISANTHVDEEMKTAERLQMLQHQIIDAESVLQSLRSKTDGNDLMSSYD
ncbi:hypothetical protein GNI_141080 [Gregarina niphandrodes]|uniref:Uncharacterized protein n=1 Tax=Gregarina niphandrodes TaxID=110365 RepID=A0A023B0A3_GRENI|nr:hypothetical protein GNI_141080 [Gregarina niphandrodes]EZG45073.1 hypothetical protein GNI_141080 [Gregarina niphandrodes]|eukprot:XP_011132577.1 hypothetical protein GNI_141080 [Gregarina niphandrodes]